MVNIQNAPATPAPGAGLPGYPTLLGKSGVFKDITGLDANQQNVIRTYLSNQENAKAFGEMAKEMAMQQHNTQNSGKIMDSDHGREEFGGHHQAGGGSAHQGSPAAADRWRSSEEGGVGQGKARYGGKQGSDGDDAEDPGRKH